MTKRHDRSNESIFDRGWGSDRPMRISRQDDNTLVEHTTLPRGEPSPGPGFIGVPHRYRPGYTWWFRAIALVAGIFLCAWLRPMFGALVSAIT